MKVPKRRHNAHELRALIDAHWPAGLIVPVHTNDEHWYRNTATGETFASVTTKNAIVKRDYKQWSVDRGLDRIRTVLDNARQQQSPGIPVDQLEAAIEAARTAHISDLNAAGAIGTGGHGIIERYMEEWIKSEIRPPAISAFYLDGQLPEEIAVARSAERFFNETGAVPVASELKIWHESKRYSGTLDSLLLIPLVFKEREGRGTDCQHIYAENEGSNKFIDWCFRCGREVWWALVLGDWKSSNSLSRKDDYAWQVTGYDKALSKIGVKTDQQWIVRLSKEKAEYEVRVIGANYKQAWKEFCAVSDVFDLIRSRSGELLIPQAEKLIIKI